MMLESCQETSQGNDDVSLEVLVTQVLPSQVDHLPEPNLNRDYLHSHSLRIHDL